MKNKYCIYSFFFSLFLSSCDPLVTSFDDVEDAVMYQSNRIIEYPAKRSINVMTWNIRFGVARLDFALDACGDLSLIHI